MSLGACGEVGKEEVHQRTSGRKHMKTLGKKHPKIYFQASGENSEGVRSLHLGFGGSLNAISFGLLSELRQKLRYLCCLFEQITNRWGGGSFFPAFLPTQIWPINFKNSAKS